MHSSSEPVTSPGTMNSEKNSISHRSAKTRHALQPVNQRPTMLPNLDALRHRIVLKGEKVSINGRMFRLPSQYFTKMRKFLDEHLAAGHIQPSSSHIASVT